MSLKEFIEIRRHNAALRGEWVRNGCPIIGTTVGWRRDPWNGQDGYRDDGAQKGIAGNGHTYSRLIRGGTDEYRKKFYEDK